MRDDRLDDTTSRASDLITSSAKASARRESAATACGAPMATALGRAMASPHRGSQELVQHRAAALVPDIPMAIGDAGAKECQCDYLILLASRPRQISPRRTFHIKTSAGFSAAGPMVRNQGVESSNVLLSLAVSLSQLVHCLKEPCALHLVQRLYRSVPEDMLTSRQIYTADDTLVRSNVSLDKHMHIVN